MALHPLSRAGAALAAAENRAALAADLSTARARFMIALATAFALGAAAFLTLAELARLDEALRCAGGV